MSDVARTPKNWAKDEVLTEQIMDALNSTEGGIMSIHFRSGSEVSDGAGN